MKKLLHNPLFYADVVLCGVMILAIAAVADKSIPQLGREVWAAIANITGDGTQSALAQFTGTNTIGNATLSYYTGVAGGTFTQFQWIDTHFACFLSGMEVHDGSDSGEVEHGQCLIVGSPGSRWSLTTGVDGGAGERTQCNVICIN